MQNGKIEVANSLINIKRFSEKYEKVYIYGAGKWGTEIARYLLNQGIDSLFFVVSDKKSCPSEILSIKILEITEITLDEKAAVIIGTKKYEEEILKEIYKMGKPNILRIDEMENVLSGINSRSWMRKRNKLEITAKIGCSIHCKYCPQETLYRNYFKDDNNRCSVMTMDSFKKCILQTPEDTVIVFSGFVEPFLHPEAVNMIRYAADLGRDLQLFTTLIGVTIDKLNQIRDIPFLAVVLHLPDREGYAEIPVTDEYFEVLKYISELKNHNGRPFVDFANCQGTPNKKALEVIEGKIPFVDAQLVDRAGNLKDKKLRKGENSEGKIICGMSLEQTHWVVLPDGTVVLCCNDFGMRHVLGNLLVSSFDEIRQGEAYLNVRRQMLKKQEGEGLLCRNCVEACILEEFPN